MVYSCDWILFSHKKEWNIDSCYNMDESWKRFAKWKKSDRKGHIQCNSIYIRCTRIGKYIETENGLVIVMGFGVAVGSDC